MGATGFNATLLPSSSPATSGRRGTRSRPASTMPVTASEKLLNATE